MKEYAPLLKSYQRQARHYDRLWRFYNRKTLQATVEAVPWEGLGRVLDVSCGTGLLEEAAQNLHPAVGVVGVDASRAMLAQARAKQGIRRSWWVNALVEELPFAGGSFDAVVCANSFHYYRHPERATAEFRRVLRPGGWLVVTDWCDDYLACKVCDWVLRVADRAHFHTYGLEGCRRLLSAGGFRVEQARRFKINWLWGLMMHRART